MVNKWQECLKRWDHDGYISLGPGPPKMCDWPPNPTLCVSMGSCCVEHTLRRHKAMGTMDSSLEISIPWTKQDFLFQTSMTVCISPLQKPDFHACLHTKICSKLCFSKSGPLALGGTDRRGHIWGKDDDWRVTAVENFRRKRWRFEARYWKEKASTRQGETKRSRGEKNH